MAAIDKVAVRAEVAGMIVTGAIDNASAGVIAIDRRPVRPARGLVRAGRRTAGAATLSGVRPAATIRPDSTGRSDDLAMVPAPARAATSSRQAWRGSISCWQRRAGKIGSWNATPRAPAPAGLRESPVARPQGRRMARRPSGRAAPATWLGRDVGRGAMAPRHGIAPGSPADAPDDRDGRRAPICQPRDAAARCFRHRHGCRFVAFAGEAETEKGGRTRTAGAPPGLLPGSAPSIPPQDQHMTGEPA